ncbi:chloride channel protein [Flavobacterium sp. 3HN19-14]|uniref:chloride channel protein n=1 Tax=Flavobacterium sp. 3HN19-14 TaxID=3448133 RepID=UPI003EE13205
MKCRFIWLFPQLYGDGYSALKSTFYHADELQLTVPVAITLFGILIFKPIATSVTLAAGGDGGVFAPSLIIGGFLGFFLAICLNTFFNADVIPVNFIILGMAAVLSASIHAPFTALFLVCGIVGDYTLFFPILAVCLIAKFTSKLIFPYTVYTFQPKTSY